MLAFEDKHRTVFKIEHKHSEEDLSSKEYETTRTKNFTGNVIKLYDQCMELLSYYTHCFDSLIDFPEDFGREIFDSAVNKLLVDNENTKTSIQIFSDAYADNFLSQCKITSLKMLNNYEICFPSIIRNTVKLDLSLCGLDDNHDLLEQIVHLVSLEVLSLADNHLSDLGLRRFLLPAANGKNLKSLRYLDISNNIITKKVLSRLSFIISLSVVVLSEECLQFWQSTELSSIFRIRKCPALEKIESQGFACPLLDKWIELSDAKAKNTSKSSGFYSKRTVPFTKIKMEVPKTKNKVMLQRIAISTKTSNHKRKADLDYDRNTQKRVKLSEKENSSNNFEQSLLDMYS